MQAVILAGGLGTRLGSLTRRTPKPMVPVGGVPYLEHQLRVLCEQDITDIVLLTGYLGDQIENHFGDGRRMGLTIRYSREQEPLGTGGALRLAQPFLADLFLLIYGDSYLPIDYRQVLNTLGATNATGLVVVYDNRLADTSVRNNVGIGRDNTVLCYDKTSATPDLEYVEAGVLAFRREVANLLPAQGAVSLEQEIFPKLVARRDLIAFPTTQRFYDIGTPERLAAIEELLSHDHHPHTV